MIGHLDFYSAEQELPLHVIPDIEMLFSEAGCLGGDERLRMHKVAGWGFAGDGGD